jgi:hypothetical protein
MPQKRKRVRKPRRELKKQISLTVSPETRAKAEMLAKEQCRSISSLFEYLIAKYEKLESENPGDPRTDKGIYRISWLRPAKK